MIEEYIYAVCVHCTAYNHACYIEDAMNGFVIQQIASPYVCVILDDASTDGTSEKIRKYLDGNFDINDKSEAIVEETSDYLFTYARHKTNKTCYFAVYFLKYNHYSISKSKKDYIARFNNISKYCAICEGDDYWIDPLKLKKQVDFMDSHHEYSMIHTRFNYLDMLNGEIKEDTVSDNAIRSIISHDKNNIPYHILLNNEYRIQTVTVLCRNDCYKKTANIILDEQGLFMMGDTQLWLNLLQFGDIMYLPEVTSVYRLSSNSASRAGSKKNRARFALSCEEMRLYYSRKLNISKKEFYNHYRRALIKYLLFDPNYRTNDRIIKPKELDAVLRLLIKTNVLKYFGWARKLVN